MLTAVRPATNDSFVSEANVPLSFSPAPTDPQTRGLEPAVPHVPFPMDRTVVLKLLKEIIIISIIWLQLIKIKFCIMLFTCIGND